MTRDGDETAASDRVAAGATSPDPRRVRSLAVTADDVVDALEANARGRRIVLRVTPPFSGRMRARLHDAAVAAGDGSGGESEGAGKGVETDVDDADGRDDGPVSVHVPPERFVADPPPYPAVDDTEDELRASSTPYSRETHRERHRAAVAAWRDRVRERLVEEVAIETDAGALAVSVSYL